MDYKNTEKVEYFEKQIKELFKELATIRLYNNWADTFYINITDDYTVLVTYHGEESFKTFKKECEGTLSSCVYSVIGIKAKIKFSDKASGKNNSTHKVASKKTFKAIRLFAFGMVFVCLAASVILVLGNFIDNRNFRETFYNVSSIKVDSNLRVIQLSDLHSASFGKDNKKLIERVEALKPDVIICTGDMINSSKEDLSFAKDLGSKLSKIAPSYYVYGNNEVETIYDVALNEKELDEKFGFNKDNRDETALLKIKDTFEEELEKTGIKVLKNEKDTIKVKTMTVDVYGVLNSNPSSFWSYSEKAFLGYLNENAENLKITAVHEPFIFQTFTPEFWGDLLVCGHTHGGMTRVPVLGPLYTQEDGLFPERSGSFVYGRYDASGSPLIVSSGLDNSSVLRINNQPELVVIDINKF